MEAFRPFLQFAQTESNIATTDDIAERPEVVDEGIEASNTQNEATESSDNGNEASTGTTVQEKSAQISYIRNSSQKRKAVEKSTSNNSSNVDKVIHFLDKRHSNVTNTCDSIDLTFQGYAASVKKLSNRRQTIVKYKIAKIIMEEELAEEAETQMDSRPGTKLIKKWRNIKNNYVKSLKKTKSGQAAQSGKRYIYARQLSFLQTAGARTETQSSFGNDDEEEDPLEEQPEQNRTKENETEKSPRYEQNSSKKRKRDLESALIDSMKAPSPSSLVASAPEPNADRSFFESILPSISNFTEDQKLEFRCEILNIIKRMRMTSFPQNYRNTPNPSPQPQFHSSSSQSTSRPYHFHHLPQPQSHPSSSQSTPTPPPSNYLPHSQSNRYFSQLTELTPTPSFLSLPQSLDIMSQQEAESQDTFRN
ncbi:unnamed protein product [Phaedon cochleariae]|uniref:BESS domain-containing protein n=1 Tax=Phaedon cochleariae TaxID=80249 RepID=A0A9N9SDT6_PHACE|nr:unnamed protein product [Phaedon cochleariae]